ncbi:ABC transporter substrate-binding protein [Advenella faeciporci]|uniref:ABC transporter substrate-binding protein n=1 Tax=Advenella faeciporci TaxID=797535 RepID=A0A918N0E0_9BURK|nr:tripartite tricarboxylate transporter substrate-binding protein [Advenella faeciporci]GGW93439.1 ABC transporter substrate-binding protein [Advenella faeciporci]
MKSSIYLQSALVLASATFALPSMAQEKSPITLVVGFAAGGTTDIVTRILSEPLSKELGKTVIVLNRAGAGGRIAAEYVKNAKPDGKTYLVGPDGWAIFPTAMHSPATLRYDLMKDLRTVAQVVSYPLALVASNQVPATNLKDYAAWLQKNPQKAQFGTPAPGGQVQFVGWVAGKTLGTHLEPVTYKGTSPMIVDLLGEQLPAAILPTGAILGHPRDKIKILGVMAEKRWELAPDAPTFIEQGYNLEVAEAWQGFFAPAATPTADINKMEAALEKVLAMEDVQQAIRTKAMLSPKFVPANEMEKMLNRDIAYWGKVIKDSGYQP